MTAYQLACGYVMVREIGSYRIELLKEHNVYHIKTYNNNIRVDWECRYTLKDAKKYLNCVKNNIEVFT